MADLFINARLTIPSSEIEILTARSSGPGGQNVNKVNSKVTLRWSPARCTGLSDPWRKRLVALYGNRINRNGQLVLHSEKYRDQPRNLNDVRQKLAAMLRETQSAPKKRRPTKPSKGSQRRRLENKAKQSAKKQGRRKDVRYD